MSLNILLLICSGFFVSEMVIKLVLAYEMSSLVLSLEACTYLKTQIKNLNLRLIFTSEKSVCKGR